MIRKADSGPLPPNSNFFLGGQDKNTLSVQVAGIVDGVSSTHRPSPKGIWVSKGWIEQQAPRKVLLQTLFFK